jgi:hypothetical protein
MKVEIVFSIGEDEGTWYLKIHGDLEPNIIHTYMPRDLYTPMTELVRCARKALHFWNHEIPEEFTVVKPTSTKVVSSRVPHRESLAERVEILEKKVNLLESFKNRQE